MVVYKSLSRRRRLLRPVPPTNAVDFRGFDSSIIFIPRGGIPRPIGDFPESLTQAMLVGVTLVGGLGVTEEHIVRDTARCAIYAGSVEVLPTSSNKHKE